jgi:hypothetical protein
MLLSKLIEAYIDVLPAGIVVDETQVTRSLIKAVRFYLGYATLLNGTLATDRIHTKISEGNETESCMDFDITPSEYSIIRPLFELYVEIENATSLEASRVMGMDVYGRQTSEIQSDIREYEADMSRKAFFEPIVSI